MKTAISVLAAFVLTAGAAWSGEEGPRPSADVSQIAFLRLTDGFWQVWIMNADGSGQKQAVKSHVDKVHVAWGPGNKEILYHTNRGETFILELATGKERRILAGLAVSDAAWSPDGRRLAYGLPPADLVKGKTSLWVSSEDGADRRKIAGGEGTDALAPQWIAGFASLPPSSSGEPRLLFRQCVAMTHMEVRHDFWTVHVAPGPLLAASAAVSGVGAPHSAPVMVRGDDETHKFDQTVSSKGVAAYSSIRTGRYEIWTIPLAGGTPRQVTNLGAYAGSPSWSPDGNRIAFDSDKEGAQQIYVIDADGKGLVRLTTGPDPSRKPVWSR